MPLCQSIILTVKITYMKSTSIDFIYMQDKGSLPRKRLQKV